MFRKLVWLIVIVSFSFGESIASDAESIKSAEAAEKAQPSLQSTESENSEKPPELSFRQRLRAQERKENEELLDRIKAMSAEEYKDYVRQQIDERFADETQRLIGFAVVDVTAEMSQTASKPGFFERLFSPPVEEPQFGSNKLETILQSKGRASAAKVPGLRMIGRHQGFDKQRHYQRVEGRFTKSQARTLIDQSNIIDFHISNQEYPVRNMFAMTHTQTGRVLPNPVDKRYDREFLNAGDYAELMKVFEQSETAMVQVSFHLPPSNGEPYPSQATLDLQELKTDEFLKDWPGYEFEVFFKGRSYVLLTTTVEHVQAMKEDNRVESISKGRF